MVLFSKIKILIVFFCFLLQYINLTNYISLKIIAVDECLRYINVSNQILLNFSEQNEACDYTYSSYNPCRENYWEKYAPDSFLIKDYEYELNTGIEITFEDWYRLAGYMAIDVYFNEYLIKYTDQTFWECKNCYNNKNETGKFDFGQERIWKNGVAFNLDVFKFHPNFEIIQECGPDFYTFVFKINDITELYKGGKNGPFALITDYYTFGNESQIIIKKNINRTKYDLELELELINFKQDDIIYSKSKASNSILAYKNNNNDFIYKICVENKEGQLKGLEPNNSQININTGDCFFETSGINYKLGNNETKVNFTEVKLKISVFKNCPEDTSIYKYCNNNTPIIKEADFIFQININRYPPESTEEITTPADSKEQTTTPMDFTEQTTTLAYSMEQTTMQVDSTEQTAKLVDSTEQTVKLVDFIEQTVKLVDSTEQMAKLVDSTEQAPKLVDSTEQAAKLVDSTEQAPKLVDSTEQEAKLVDSTEQATTLIDLFYKKIILYNINKTEQQELIKEIDSAIISHRIDSSLNNLTKGNFEDLIINFENIKYHITSSLNQNVRVYDDISTIDLGDCENILKNQFNITQSDTLIIFKIDVLDNSSIPIILYQVYHPITKERLNLTNCNNAIEVSYPVNINEKELFKYDPSNDFYSDICRTYTTEFQTDITIKDRQKEYINKNLSLCEEDCTYNNYDIETKKVTCECYIKVSFPIISEIKINKDKLMKKFMNIKESINLKIMKCYKLLFTKEGITTNIGSYLLSFIIFIFIVSTIIFPSKIYENLYKKVKNIYEQKICESKSDKQNKNIINEQMPEENNHKNIRSEKETMKIEMSNNSPSKKKSKRRKSFKISSHLNLNFSENKKIVKKKENNILENNIIKINEIMNYNDYELNMMEYKYAIIYDKRSYWQFYISLLKTKHIFIFTFFNSKDYNSMIIKICLFLFFLALNYTINALFFSDSTIHEIYLEKGEYNFIYQLPQIIYSAIIISVINIIVKYLFLTEKNIIKFKNEKSNDGLEAKVEELLKCLKIKIIIFYTIGYIILIFFWYYLACFCAVYKNTQIYFIKNTAISLGISLVYPFGLYLLPGIFRITSIRNNEKKTMYNASQIIQFLL